MPATSWRSGTRCCAAATGSDTRMAASAPHCQESRDAVAQTQGGTADDIAAGTGRSRTTVNWHIRHICAAFGVSLGRDRPRVREVQEEPASIAVATACRQQPSGRTA